MAKTADRLLYGAGLQRGSADLGRWPYASADQRLLRRMLRAGEAGQLSSVLRLLARHRDDQNPGLERLREGCRARLLVELETRIGDFRGEPLERISSWIEEEEVLKQLIAAQLEIETTSASPDQGELRERLAGAAERLLITSGPGPRGRLLVHHCLESFRAWLEGGRGVLDEPRAMAIIAAAQAAGPEAELAGELYGGLALNFVCFGDLRGPGERSGLRLAELGRELGLALALDEPQPEDYLAFTEKLAVRLRRRRQRSWVEIAERLDDSCRLLCQQLAWRRLGELPAAAQNEALLSHQPRLIARLAAAPRQPRAAERRRALRRYFSPSLRSANERSQAMNQELLAALWRD
jgi:hypothetical protein